MSSGAVYEIATKITMVNGVSGVLAVLASDLLRVEGGVKKLEESFKTLNRTSVAMLGGLGIFVGKEVLSGFKHIADHGEKLLDQQDKLQRAGISYNEVLKAQNTYWRDVAKQVPTATVSDYLKTYNEMRSVVGADDALEKTPWALRLQAITDNMSEGGGKVGGKDAWKLLRALEMKGITITDPKGSEELAAKMVQNIIGSGGKLSASDFANIASTGGTAWIKASPRYIATSLSNLASDLGGMRTGTAMMTLNQTLSGATKLGEAQYAEFAKLGLLHEKQIGWNKKLNQPIMGIDSFVDSGLAMSDTDLWVQRYMVPALDRIYGKDDAKRNQSLAIMGRNRHTRRMFEAFSNPGLIAQAQKDSALWEQAHGVHQSYDEGLSRNPVLIKQAFHKQYESMMQAMGAPMMTAAIPVMKSVTGFFTEVGAFANAHPNTFKILGYGIAFLGSALVGGGALAIMGALGPAGWIAGGIGVLGAAVVNWWPQIKAGWNGMIDGIAKFGNGMKNWGEKLGTTLDGVRTKAIEWGTSFTTTLTGFFTDAVPNKVKEWVSAIGNAFDWLIGKIKGFVGGLFGFGGGGGAAGMGGATANGSGFNPGAVVGGSHDPVANAAGMLGASEIGNNADIQQYLRTGGMGMNPAKVAWCAAFVNASLAKAGIKGTGSAAAISFAHWGNPVNGPIQRGDVLVRPHHVGILTGNTQNGLAEMISGNHGNAVSRSWESLRNAWVRRKTSFAPPMKGSQLASASPTVILEVDGRELGRSASKHVAQHHEHTRQSPYFNGHGMFAGPDHSFAVG